MVGGLGPESTIDYYRRTLDEWRRHDPSTTPSIVIDSLDVGRALYLVEHDRQGLIDYLLASIRRLAGAGVDFAVMTANTPHIVFDELAGAFACSADEHRRSLCRRRAAARLAAPRPARYPVHDAGAVLSSTCASAMALQS